VPSDLDELAAIDQAFGANAKPTYSSTFDNAMPMASSVQDKVAPQAAPNTLAEDGGDPSPSLPLSIASCPAIPLNSDEVNTPLASDAILMDLRFDESHSDNLDLPPQATFPPPPLSPPPQDTISVSEPIEFLRPEISPSMDLGSPTLASFSPAQTITPVSDPGPNASPSEQLGNPPLATFSPPPSVMPPPQPQVVSALPVQKVDDAAPSAIGSDFEVQEHGRANTLSSELPKHQDSSLDESLSGTKIGPATPVDLTPIIEKEHSAGPHQASAVQHAE
jgi:hypothetical protein